MKSNSKLRIFQLTAIVFSMGITSCVPKSFFTTEIRTKVEADSIPLSKLQFYVDRDVELRREVSSANTKVTSGQVKFENGKYVHIILLKKFTPGVCTQVHKNSIEISFDMGDGKTLTFGVTAMASPNEIYRLFANEWINEDIGRIGKIKYDNETYYIQPGGADARLMIKKSVIANLTVEKKTMSGVKVK
ncbi:MAG: hypothetical protein ACLQQ4_09215 [Bacteroidia bacterium]